MDELVTQTMQLPDNLPDLAKFVLIGREKLNAVRASIRAIDKVGLAQEVREQKLHEAQDIADAVLDAEARIGELMARVPKASFDRGNQYTGGKTTAVSNSQKPKSEVIKEAGFTPKQVERFQTIAKHPEAVEMAKEEARTKDEIVTRSAVFQKIKEQNKPHIANNSGDNEWYTPPEFIESARKVMGSIDLDPASNSHANKTVKASTFFTEEDDGLTKKWFGNVWLNPPYSSTLVVSFADKVAEREFEQAVVLVNNATETKWFKTLIDKADAFVFKTGRIKFLKYDGQHNAPLQGQAFIYFGNNVERFLAEFEQYGWGGKL